MVYLLLKSSKPGQEFFKFCHIRILINLSRKSFMLIHKFCKKLLIFLLLLLLFLSRSLIILLMLLINSPSLIHKHDHRLGGTLDCGLGCRPGHRPSCRLCGRLCGRLGFSYFDSHTRPRVEEEFWLISTAEWRAFCIASFLAYTVCICLL